MFSEKDRFYVCKAKDCGAEFHVSAGDAELAGCLVDGCDGKLKKLTVEDFAERHPEFVTQLAPFLPDPEAEESPADEG